MTSWLEPAGGRAQGPLAADGKTTTSLQYPYYTVGILGKEYEYI